MPGPKGQVDFLELQQRWQSLPDWGRQAWELVTLGSPCSCRATSWKPGERRSPLG